MIRYLFGKVIFKKQDFVVLNVGGVGYKVFVSKNTLLKIPDEGGNVEIFCFLNVKENALELYGFLNEKELEFFEVLKNIRGVGPKAALKIASIGSLEEIKERVLSKDEKLFEKIPGIGRKKAMSIILELTGKIKDIDRNEGRETKSDEAEDGLVSLGFSRKDAKIALSKISQDAKDTEQKIKEALKFLGK